MNVPLDPPLREWALKMSRALLVGLSLAVAACTRSPFGDPPQPAIVESLVAAAPTGSKVTVTHVGADPFGGFTAHWEWTVTGVPMDVTMDVYSTWCQEQGLTPKPSEDVGMFCGGIDFYFEGDEDVGPAVWGSINDDNPLIR